MGKLNKFQVMLDNERGGVFYPGEVMNGNVIVDVKEELKIKGNKSESVELTYKPWSC